MFSAARCNRPPPMLLRTAAGVTPFSPLLVANRRLPPPPSPLDTLLFSHQPHALYKCPAGLHALLQPACILSCRCVTVGFPAFHLALLQAPWRGRNELGATSYTGRRLPQEEARVTRAHINGRNQSNARALAMDARCGRMRFAQGPALWQCQHTSAGRRRTLGVWEGGKRASMLQALKPEGLLSAPPAGAARREAFPARRPCLGHAGAHKKDMDSNIGEQGVTLAQDRKGRKPRWEVLVRQRGPAGGWVPLVVSQAKQQRC
jgi:hypothetical protein